jgi:branched-chain amino acid transport system permease protein
MDRWLEQVVNGLTIGGVYALIAVGYTMVYGVLQMINFAHGEVFMMGAFGGYYALRLMEHASLSGPATGLMILIAVLVGAVVACVVAMLVERIAYRPLRHAPRLAPLISAIGVSIFLQNVMLRVTNARPLRTPVTFPERNFSIGGVEFQLQQLIVIAASILVMAALYLFVMRTKTGRAIRAVSEDRDVAALMGVNVDRAIVTTFVVGAAAAGVAGVLVAIFFRQVDFFMGFLPGIKAFTAAVLGGIGNVPGAMLGGYVLGLAEALGSQALPTAYKDLIAFAILVLVLVLRPHGLLGERLSKRA